MNKDHVAVVLSMFETGLAVGRSLGRKGVKVYGFDHKKDIGFFSKYIKASICPHPITEEQKFIDFFINFSRQQKYPPVLFIASDDFLISVSRNWDILHHHFLFTHPEYNFITKIADKFEQYKMAKENDISLPKTYIVRSLKDIKECRNNLVFPVLIKGLDVTQWRKEISGTIKGFVISNNKQLDEKVSFLIEKKVFFLIQEIIEGPDTSHYKYNTYISEKGKVLAEFTLQKLRQNPIRYGVGSLVQSIKYDDLLYVGRKLFKAIGYTGVGSAEFKLDKKDGKLKLIEINPRYWQQNSLTTKCGINFPLINYLDLTGQNPTAVKNFQKDIKWLNIYMDFDSFMKYRKEGELSGTEWIKSLRGKKILSDYAFDDLLPGLYEIGFGLKLFRLPLFVLKRLF